MGLMESGDDWKTLRRNSNALLTAASAFDAPISAKHTTYYSISKDHYSIREWATGENFSIVPSEL